MKRERASGQNSNSILPLDRSKISLLQSYHIIQCECILAGPTGQHVLWSVPMSNLTCDLNVIIRGVHHQPEGNQNIQ